MSGCPHTAMHRYRWVPRTLRLCPVRQSYSQHDGMVPRQPACAVDQLNLTGFMGIKIPLVWQIAVAHGAHEPFILDEISLATLRATPEDRDEGERFGSWQLRVVERKADRVPASLRWAVPGRIVGD